MRLGIKNKSFGFFAAVLLWGFTTGQAAAQSPSISVNWPTGIQSGDITFTYIITDSDSSLVGLLAEYSINQEASWQVANVSGDTSDIAQADYNVATNCPEAAWPLVEEAQANTRDRVYLLSNRGRFERLRRHHMWITQGWSAVERLSESENLKERCIQLSGRFETGAVEDWIRIREGVGMLTQSSTFDELRSRKLHGILSRLSTLQIHDGPSRNGEH